jgi:anti-sigma factor RsiW
MECRKWEEVGLLYCAHEVEAGVAAEYEEHLKECEECRREVYCYGREHERFFTPEILGEAPPPKLDAEILRVCSHRRKKVPGFTLFPAFFSRALVPLSLFAVGFISVGYIVLNMQNARYLNAAAPQAEKAAVVAAQKEATAPAAAAIDSAGDSLRRGPKVNFARTRGNLNDEGVMSVDLKNK